MPAGEEFADIQDDPRRPSRRSRGSHGTARLNGPDLRRSRKGRALPGQDPRPGGIGHRRATRGPHRPPSKPVAIEELDLLDPRLATSAGFDHRLQHLQPVKVVALQVSAVERDRLGDLAPRAVPGQVGALPAGPSWMPSARSPSCERFRPSHEPSRPDRTDACR